VLVYFYTGNPDTGGSYLGSATITGGISQGGAKAWLVHKEINLSSFPPKIR
jgi:hypothetical protein